MRPPGRNHSAKRTPRGRPSDGGDERQIGEIILHPPGGPPPPRHLLIEFLHKIQDHFGALHARHIAALAQIMRLSQAEVSEVASFYHHFDIVREGENAPPPLTVRICDSLPCRLAGAEPLIEELGRITDPQMVRICRASCQGRCAAAPCAILGRREIDSARAEDIRQAIDAVGPQPSNADFTPHIPPYTGLDACLENGGYALLKALRAGKTDAEEIIGQITRAQLRGAGGAGFPAGRKWEIVRACEGAPVMTVNGDEGEPGTFKDRHYLASDPHRILEGALIAAHCVGASHIYFYLRDEYPAILEILGREIAALAAAGLTDACPIELRRGAGAYICGEESAMIESIEGKRGLPRHRPPYIAEKGLFGRPTLNHNVETLYWVRDIVQKGAQWFSGQGKEGHCGPRSFSVSGRVKEPGVKVLPAGSTVHEVIAACGGMAEGHRFAAFLPGGASGGIFPASKAGLPLDFGVFEPLGGLIGSHALVILSDMDDVYEAAHNLLRFFHHESCGQCTPCRAGTKLLADLAGCGQLEKTEEIAEIEQVMRDASICGLGQAAPNALRCALTYFDGPGAHRDPPHTSQPDTPQPDTKQPGEHQAT